MPAHQGTAMAAGWLPAGIDKADLSFMLSARHTALVYGNHLQGRWVSLIAARSERDILQMDGPIPPRADGKAAMVNGHPATIRYQYRKGRDGPSSIVFLITWKRPSGLWSGALTVGRTENDRTERVDREQLRAHALQVAATAHFPANVEAARMPAAR